MQNTCQLLIVHRLEKIIKDAKLDALLGVGEIVISGNHHKHTGNALLPERADHLQPCHARHFDIQKGGVGLLFTDQPERLHAVFRFR